MKMTRILFIYLLFFSFNIYSQTQDRMDGNWWNKLEPKLKFSFIVGFFEGMDLGNYFSYWGMSNSKKDLDCSTKAINSYKYYANKYFNRITTGQLVDGLNEFFSDYRNRRIKISSSIWLVTNSIVGTPKEVVDKMIESWRKNDAD